MYGTSEQNYNNDNYIWLWQTRHSVSYQRRQPDLKSGGRGSGWKNTFFQAKFRMTSLNDLFSHLHKKCHLSRQNCEWWPFLAIYTTYSFSLCTNDSFWKKITTLERVFISNNIWRPLCEPPTPTTPSPKSRLVVVFCMEGDNSRPTEQLWCTPNVVVGPLLVAALPLPSLCVAR